MPESREIRSEATIFLAYPASPALNAHALTYHRHQSARDAGYVESYALKRIVFRTFRHDEMGRGGCDGDGHGGGGDGEGARLEIAAELR